ncbi:unnamed protein product [Symbiodinium sp. CCMP2592]|nr:unnamed protein product [Symbiodinium sp. CCMP2592]
MARRARPDLDAMWIQELQAYLDGLRKRDEKRNKQVESVRSVLVLGCFLRAPLQLAQILCLEWRWVKDAADSWTCGFGKSEALDGVLIQLHKEARYAMEVIRKAQIALLLASFSMGWHIASWGVSWLITPQEAVDAFQYGAMVNTLGDTPCMLLLINSFLQLASCSSYIPIQSVDAELPEEEDMGPV